MYASISSFALFGGETAEPVDEVVYVEVVELPVP